MKQYLKWILISVSIYILCFVLNTFIFCSFGLYNWGDVPTKLVLARMIIFPLIMYIIIVSVYYIVKNRRKRKREKNKS